MIYENAKNCRRAGYFLNTAQKNESLRKSQNGTPFEYYNDEIMLIRQNVKNLFKTCELLTKCLSKKRGTLLILIAAIPLSSMAGESHSTDLKLPPTLVIQKENDSIKVTSKTKEPIIDKEQEQHLQSLSKSNKQEEACQTTLVSQDLERKYLEIQRRLESDFKRGMPKQLRTDLVRVRTDIDDLIGQLFDIDTNNPQEINHIVQLTVDYLEKMIGLLPKANKIAPMVRDRYVVPFTNISSIKAEHQECLMKNAIAEVKEKNIASDDGEASMNTYRKLTEELKNLNQSLYTLQTTDVQKFINFRADLLYKLEKFNKRSESGSQVTANIPKILNSVHNEIERLLPGLQLSENFYSTFH